MVDLDGYIWRPITRSKRADVAHLIPSPLEYSARTLCNEPIDPYFSDHSPLLQCQACVRIAKERTKEAA